MAKINMKIIGGAYLSMVGNTMWKDEDLIPGISWLGMNYTILTTIGETLELLGITAFIYAFFYIANDMGGVQIDISREENG
jgi:hypothetical protein